MSDQPFMQLYVADYLADTLDLSTVEHGAYLLLLMTMWRHDAKLPHDMAKLARIARMTPKKFEPVWAEISRFFTIDGEIISNRRLTKEHQKAKEKSAVRATAGRAGGKAKALKDNKPPLANATDLAWQGQKSESDTVDVGGSARANDADLPLRERLLWAAGIDPQTIIDRGPGARGGSLDMAEAERWIDLFKGDADAVVRHVADIRSGMNDPPGTLRYFTKPLQKIAGAKSAPPLRPIEGAANDRPSSHDRRSAAATDALRDALHVAGTMRRPSSKDCF